MSVAIGIIHDDKMDSLFVRSLLNLRESRRSEVDGLLMVGGGQGRLDLARNEVTRLFLKTESDWLLTLDTDIVFSLADFDKLVEEASPKHLNSGIYFVDERPPRACAARVEGKSIKSIEDWEEGQIIPVDYTGAGFMLTHRNVFEAIKNEWYTQDIKSPSGGAMGEDYCFCRRAAKRGHKVLVNSSVFVGHVKPRVLGYE